MNLTGMRAIVRRDLHDEDANNYRWTDNEIDRHLAHALKDYSEAVPREQIATKMTTAGSREISISDLIDLVAVEAVEYPVGKFPKCYQRFSLWADTITLLGADVPDGSGACIYYGKLHTLDAQTCTIPAWHEDLVATGACGYAVLEWAEYAINRVNTGGASTATELLAWGQERLAFFRQELKRLGRSGRVRAKSLYVPYREPVSKATDPGP